ncbi:hypothetical protein DB347_04105 [Opitutaceae bacterium EW11]|nr:hypothetical protein DB347_04105 [Opitutaceae bacterium EW11]
MHDATSAPSLRVGIVVLAAGASSRMGKPKPLLPIEGQPLAVRAARASLEAKTDCVVFVLGCAADSVAPVLAPWPVSILRNDRWNDGIGSSIRCGIQALSQFQPLLDGALITLCDQPGLTSAAIRRLIDAFSGPQGLVAARYLGAVGAPAIFGRDYFPELLSLPPDAGAQRVLKKHSDIMVPVDLPDLAVDLDTPDDYRRCTEKREPPGTFP